MRDTVVINPVRRGVEQLDIAFGLICIAAAALGTRWMETELLAMLPLAIVLVISLYSHKRCMRSEENDWPLLVAGVVSFLVLFVMLFNDAPALLWGLTHFIFMPTIALWIALAALLFAWHANSLTWLDRASTRLADRGPLPWYAFYLPPIALFWALRSYFITEDGFGCTGVAHGYVGLDAVGREPLAYLSLRGTFLAISPLGVDARDAVWAVSILSGVAALVALRRLWRLWQLDTRQTLLAWGTTAATFGVTQMWFGHIEVYPPFVASVIWLFYLAGKSLRYEESLWLPGLAYALAFAFHIAAAWMAPGMLALVILASRGKGGRAWMRFAVQIGLPFLTVHVLLWSAILAFGFHFDFARFGRTLAEIVGAGRMTPAFYRPHEMALAYWVDRTQMLFTICAAPVLLLGFSLAFPSLHEKQLRSRRLFDPEMLFFLISMVGFGVYVFFWRQERQWIQDWDLFAGFAPMVLIVALKTILWRRPGVPLLRAFQIVLGLFLVIGGLKTVFYHTTPTSLYNGFSIPNERGYELQEYLIDHLNEYPEKMPTVVNGKLAIIENRMPINRHDHPSSKPQTHGGPAMTPTRR